VNRLIARLARSSLAQRLVSRLTDGVVWITDTTRSLTGEPTDRSAWCVILGREYYQETRRRYPIRRWVDLQRVVRLELADRVRSVAVIGPVLGDEREVVFYDIHPELDIDCFGAIFWVPETLLLKAAVPAGRVVTIDRYDHRYFLTDSGVSQSAGGALQSAELFSLAVGVPGAPVELPVNTDDILAALPKALPVLGASEWWFLRAPGSTARTLEWAVPAGALVGAFAILYLTLASLYLVGMEAWRTYSIDRLGPEVTTLIAKQRAVDLLSQEAKGLDEIIQSQVPVWPVWGLITEVWKTGGAVAGINLTDDRLVVRGSAPVATDVLSALSKLPDYEDAKFDAAVRQGGRGQEYVISLRRKMKEAKP